MRLLPDGSPPWRRQFLCHGAPASCFRLLPVPAVPPRRPSQQVVPMALPASNKPHSAEKSTPVWLAIWHIWAGFANSQLLPDAAALSSMQGLLRSGNSSAQTSASLHPPAALRLRCLPFTSRGTWSSTVCAEEFPTPLEMSLHGLHLLRQTQISRAICTDWLRHLRVSAG